MKQPKKPAKYLTMSEAARRLKVSRAAVFAAIKAKRLKATWGTMTVRHMVTRKMKGWIILEKDVDRYEVSAHQQATGKKN